jgi:hypothetical protein
MSAVIVESVAISKPAQIPGPRLVVGIVHSVTADAVAFVDYPGNKDGPLQARVAGTPGAPNIGPGSSVVLLFEEDDSTRPVILAPVHDRLISESRAPSLVDDLKAAIVDGRRVVLEARQEIVLRCGKGSITLTANGKVVIKGTELVSRSSGANKIKGALVNIN